ncbi:MAG: MTH938/NDUFAF3 family protein, partial [Brevefilum sp.]
KDIFILGETVQPWSARKGHKLKPSMVDCVIGRGIRVLVIGNGVNGAIRVSKKTREKIRTAGIETLIVEKTPEACRVYNELVRQRERTALLAHGTC